MKRATLVLSDKTKFEGQIMGYHESVSGEVVFATGMVGYEQSLTDPSYKGQILVFTYPLIGNWGVPDESEWESDKIQVQAVIISDLTLSPSHHSSKQTLDTWLKGQKIPALVGIDTRALTQKLREKGVMLGKIVVEGKDIPFVDPNERNLVAEVSIQKVLLHIPFKGDSFKGPRIGLLNCGAKANIVKCLTKRGATVYELPWNYDPFENEFVSLENTPGVVLEDTPGVNTGRSLESTPGVNTLVPKLDGLMISNGPGNPKMARESIYIIRKSLEKKLPTFGICLGNQLLALAAGGDTYKLKFGHRAQNQPTIDTTTGRCYITTQNHGFAVNEKRIPKGFERWFYNANDNTNEGIIHKTLPFFSVQFHPEATPGPTDTEWLFDFFLNVVKDKSNSFFLQRIKGKVFG